MRNLIGVKNVDEGEFNLRGGRLLDKLEFQVSFFFLSYDYLKKQI